MTPLDALPCAVPVEEQLESIPADARLSWTETDGLKATHFVPIGRLAHEAAAAIRELRDKQRLPNTLVDRTDYDILEAERDALKADAERYRWLRYRLDVRGARPLSGTAPRPALETRIGYAFMDSKGPRSTTSTRDVEADAEKLDAAIDEARRP